ncbi:MAG: redox-regulated ATPase YchF [Chitinivibrionia bacterium]|nr:redox-regulated ATPase YchF [Chitinivibrionia bacterium]
MSVSAGIVGLPNVGKSTIFNAISSGKAETANYPFCTIDPNSGVVSVPDIRLEQISEIIPTKKIVPALLELVDIAGLVKGASTGEGLGNQFLGHIKSVNAILHVVRCFDCAEITHVDGSIDPKRDVGVIDTELMLKDLETLEKSKVRLEKMRKVGDKEVSAKLEVTTKAIEQINNGIPARTALSDDEKPLLSELHLITIKPVLYVANVDEAGLKEDNKFVKELQEIAEKDNALCIKISGKIEEELAELEKDDKLEFLADLGLTEPGLNVLARAAYDLLDLQTFFTAGETENRAWTIKKGFTAPQAAGVIHSDFERGFIKAEVYTLADLLAYKSETEIRNHGKIRLEGKDYVVKDGDIMFFKFNV